MAGSYNHITNDEGQFIGASLLENLGDAYEAIEECYGMIWWLAKGDKELVEQAEKFYKNGLDLSPGVVGGY